MAEQSSKCFAFQSYGPQSVRVANNNQTTRHLAANTWQQTRLCKLCNFK